MLECLPFLEGTELGTRSNRFGFGNERAVGCADTKKLLLSSSFILHLPDFGPDVRSEVPRNTEHEDGRAGALGVLGDCLQGGLGREGANSRGAHSDNGRRRCVGSGQAVQKSGEGPRMSGELGHGPCQLI